MCIYFHITKEWGGGEGGHFIMFQCHNFSVSVGYGQSSEPEAQESEAIRTCTSHQNIASGCWLLYELCTLHWNINSGGYCIHLVTYYVPGCSQCVV